MKRCFFHCETSPMQKNKFLKLVFIDHLHSQQRRSRFLSRQRLKINSPLLCRFASLFLLLLFGMLHSVVEAQFKMIDSSNFRMKKGVSNSSASIAFVQINHYVDPVGDQSRAFTIEQHQGEDPNLIKVHIQYQNANDIHGGHAKLLSSMETDRGETTNGPSSLHRIIENNKKRKENIRLRAFLQNLNFSFR